MMAVRSPMNYRMDLDCRYPIYDDSSFELDAQTCRTHEVLMTYRVKPCATSPYLRVTRDPRSYRTDLIHSTLKTSKIILS
jgi:hypothetical protein